MADSGERGLMTALLGQFAALFVGMLLIFAGLTAAVTLAARRVEEKRLRQWLGGNTITAPLKGLVVGALTPFCSWSTVPVLVSLLRARVRVSAVAAFYLASPVLDPVLIIVLAMLFGVPVAAAFTAFIAVTTLAGGVLAERLHLERLVLEHVGASMGPAGCGDEPLEAPWQGWAHEAGQAWVAARNQARRLLGPLALACALAVAIAGVAPRGLIVDLAGPRQPLAVPAAALLGVPLYLPTEALAPLGWALRDAGVSTGALFAMVITAAGLSIPEFSLLAGVLRPRLIAGLIVFVTATAVTGGLTIPRLAALVTG